ncbi:beta-glucosidase Cel3D [Cellvibrio japonicus]|uniref:Putative 1,4-beta-D-glucan glucohydrolase cel3D n=1 Tax=Cellvibrio japonicus (strain Ueda107) TaxID=498211 RepID=B3PBS6_CELJU|nr:beta-glucosidase Cel3D [Cellvibrio japonicus]ACE82897.1 putative 1,4-beta-D-glucan glucohydrolase cel3D [Cellvibrio japonicus Ueda107]QEI11744.1 glycoside hydrolase family 3 protein [Cellvibrio japonicus]QEI15318.1 glycoside hydrolase family 3 protein [Cellvibrio japonicus]QEI18898.1 glycoside hydrolase family 3 protein [Cellvibrio japonicus]
MKKRHPLATFGLIAAALLTGSVLVQAAPDTNIKLWPKPHSPIQDSAEFTARVDAILQKMTLEEKVGQIMQAEIQTVTPEDVKKYHLGSVLNGGGSMPNRIENAKPKDWVEFYDALYDASMDTSDGGQAVPILWGTDAVHGHNNLTGATLFPHNIGLGATHNAELIRRIGAATAKEVRSTGIEWVFAPTLAVAQNDRWGRTYESYAEDPKVVATLATAMVEGLQGKVNTREFLTENHVIATAKHFLADGGTEAGDDQGNARINEKELIKIHNAGYVPAIEAGVQTIMASFSEWNGQKVHGSHYLLTEVLKNRMGFDGFVVGDWNGHGQVPGCTNDSCAQAINAGIDLVMVTYDWKDMITNTLAQVKSGEISQARLDDAVRRILRVKMRAGLWEKKPSARANAADLAVVGSAEHRAIARQAVRESLVLLKNANKVLPINPRQTVLVAGDAADHIGKQAGGWSVWWQGVADASENYRFPGATSIYAGIKQAVEHHGGKVVLSVDGSFTQKPDVAVVVFGENPYAEGSGDRATLEFEPAKKKSLALLKTLKAQGIPVVSVFISGRPLWVNPELNASDAFVAAWLPGSEGAGVADVVIAGADGKPRYDFTGRLSFSWPKSPLQDVLNPHHKGYQPLFKLGYGLHYKSGKAGPEKLPENMPGVASDKPQDIELYVRRPLEPWHIFIENYERQQILSGAFAALPKGDVKAITSDKDVQEDALTFTWKDTWRAGLTLEGGEPLDLTAHVKTGALSLDINIIELAKGGVSFKLECQRDGCERLVPYTLKAREMLGKGWHKVIVPLSCFVHEGDDFSAVTMPFALETGGAGQVEVANMQLLLNTPKDASLLSCPDYKTQSVTPDMLNEWWALEWWLPRHEQKLKDKQAILDKKGQVDLLFIGDSITQGWEKEGAEVWKKYYAKRNAFNLGFGGDRTENVLWRLRHGAVDGLDPKLVVLMIGTNNTGHRKENPAGIAAGIQLLLSEIQQRLPNSRVLLLAIFPRDANADGQLRQNNEKTNALIAGLADKRKVFFRNINAQFLAKDGELPVDIMPDLLHPNEKGYAIWAKAIEQDIQSLMK